MNVEVEDLRRRIATRELCMENDRKSIRLMRRKLGDIEAREEARRAQVSGREWHTMDEAAEVARRSSRAMRNLRSRGAGPPFRKIDGRLLVHDDDLRAWMSGELP